MSNPFEFFRNHTVAMIAHGFAFDAVRDNLELKGASEVWGGPDTDDRAAWYFWLARSPGAYQLRLAHADTVELGGSPALRGVFTIKYYPTPQEPVFRHFSTHEQALIEGDAFDDTNTPDMDALDRVPDNLFSVGTMEFTHDREHGQSFLKFSSLDEMRFEETADEAHNGAGDPVHLTNGTRRIRQLPTWDIGYRLFDAIVGLHALVGRQSPKRIMLSEQPGFELVELVDGSLQDRDCDSVKLRSVLVAFRSEVIGVCSPVEEAITARQCASPRTALLDTGAHGIDDIRRHRRHVHGPACGHEPPHDHDTHACGESHGPARFEPVQGLTIGDGRTAAPIEVNEHWWTLAENKQTANTLPCGCSH